MPSSTVENYVKHIYLEHQRCGGELVPLGLIAGVLDVVPGTVTTMVKSLAESGLARYEPRQGVRLTSKGELLALRVIRRHRLIELFLVQVIGFDWADVHVEAEELEHVVSDKLLDKIDEILGHPSVDPHGDFIPSPSGKIDTRKLQSLIECKAKQQVRIARISDQDAVFLKYATERGLTLGAQLSVVVCDSIGGSITVSLSNGSELTLGSAACGKIWVGPLEAKKVEP